jgi:hypothetical protein
LARPSPTSRRVMRFCIHATKYVSKAACIYVSTCCRSMHANKQVGLEAYLHAKVKDIFDSLVCTQGISFHSMPQTLPPWLHPGDASEFLLELVATFQMTIYINSVNGSLIGFNTAQGLYHSCHREFEYCSEFQAVF